MAISDGTAAELAQRAAGVAGWIAIFRELAPIAASVAVAFPDDKTIDRAVGFLTDVDIVQILSDLDAVVGAYGICATATGAVAAQPLSTSWQGHAGTAASSAVDTHMNSRNTELATLIAAADAATPTFAGLKLLLQNVFHALEMISDPLLAGHPLSTVSAALGAGTLRAGVIAEEIDARVRLFTTATAIGRSGVRNILAELVGVDSAASSGELALAGDQ
ncbi:hypothetical protein GOEFS_078_00040 [Gordonia effusa NBRC 100432]|uniref:Uncharacterized protein n=1 Tax=Gordonia effusa NBRC 100432 TaxID=1077974 RepID=H0R2G9_9ACTN|nr:hypothetical protein [Gordonia effusa]GAB19270.1 hypothetical protein GOEFS_078_00040 [Gordonia effusa NBRC 100432]